MSFVIDTTHYKSEAKNIIRAHLLRNPSHEWDDFRENVRGARYIPRATFKEVKVDLQKDGLIPMVMAPGEKAYDIIMREAEKKLKEKKEEELRKVEEWAATPPAPKEEPQPESAPMAGEASPPPEAVEETPPSAEQETKLFGLQSPYTGRFVRNGQIMSARKRLEIEQLIVEMPDLMPTEIVKAFNIPGFTAANASQIKTTVLREHAAYKLTQQTGSDMSIKPSAEAEKEYTKIRENLSKLSKADVLSMAATAYQARFHHTLKEPNRFYAVKAKLKKAWESGQGPAAHRPAAATLSGSHLPAPVAPVVAHVGTLNGNNGEGQQVVLTSGATVALIGSEKFAEGEAKVLKNILPMAVREALRKFGIAPPEFSCVMTENEQDEKFLELRVK